MPETSSLCLHSPAGSDVAVYKWPLHVSDSWNEPHELVETIRWVCYDFPELKLAVENYVLNMFDPTSFESMKLLCEKYNRAVDNIRKLWSGRQPPPCIDAPPTLQLLKHTITQVYNRAITKPEELNTYQAFSPEVYGETSFELVSEMISATHMNENDVFLDLGSGVGQIVLQVAATVGCKSYGIEKAEIPAKYAEEMNRQFLKWMDFYGKCYGDFELLKGDFLDPQFDEIFQSATVIFCNNFAFGPTLNHKLKLKFQNLRDGVKIVSSREFCPLNFRITERNLSDIGAMMRVVELSPLKGSVSWTSKPVSYYLHKIDRTRLEEFFHKQKHPEEVKSEGSISSYCQSPSNCSTDSSLEDSSLDSSNEDDDFFKRPSEEMHHFPPPNNKSSCSTNYYQSKKQQPIHNNITSSAIQKKITPPSGTTHLPRPHPQSVINKSPYIASRNRVIPSNHRQVGGVKIRKKPATQNKGFSRRGRRTKSSLDMTPLFECFQSQMMTYIDQMNNPQYVSWVTDTIEKEKMKRKHLQGVIEHLESEVTTLSLETINNMKDSMSSLGITNLTPEGLLLGAKDIVMLNRQLRREVEMLENDVFKLREENDFINCLCKQPDVNNNKGQSQETIFPDTDPLVPLLPMRVTSPPSPLLNVATHPIINRPPDHRVVPLSIDHTPSVSTLLVDHTPSGTDTYASGSGANNVHVASCTSLSSISKSIPFNPNVGVSIDSLMYQPSNIGLASTSSNMGVVNTSSSMGVAGISSNMDVAGISSNMGVASISSSMGMVGTSSNLVLAGSTLSNVGVADNTSINVGMTDVSSSVGVASVSSSNVGVTGISALLHVGLEYASTKVGVSIESDDLQNDKTTSSNVGVASTNSASCTCLTVEEAYSGSVEFSEIDKYQISLETIDQAVLELGPFAKDIVTERSDVPPLQWPHPVDNQLTKKERKKPYSPPTSRMMRKGRASGDCMSPLSSVGSPMGIEPLSKPRRSNGKKKQQQPATDMDSSPLLIVSDEQSATPIPINIPETIETRSSSNNSTNSSIVNCSENSAVEAMLALSNARQSELQQQSVDAPYTITPPMIVQDTPISSLPPKIHYPLPPLNRLAEPSSTRKRQTVAHHGSSSSIKSSSTIDDNFNNYSPHPHSLPVPPPLKSPQLEESVKIPKEDKRSVNPFWPISTSLEPASSTSASFPYSSLMTFPGWNTMGGLHPTYLPSTYPALSRADVTPSLDLTAPPTSFRSTVLPPYYIYNPNYPFGAGGLATPLTNQLLTSSASSLQSPNVSSPIPNHPLSYNPYITPPTLHPLTDVVKPKEVIQANTPWMMLNAAQFPQGSFLNTGQFAAATGLGMGSPHLSLFTGLQPTGLIGGVAGEMPDMKRRTDHDNPIMYSTPGLHYTSDDIGGRKPAGHSSYTISHDLSSSGGGGGVLPTTSTTSNNKKDRRRRLKIHQINKEDFSNKLSDKPPDRRSRKVTEWEIPQTMYNAGPSSLSKTINVAMTTPTPTIDYRAAPPISTQILPVPQSHLPTLVTMSSVDDNDPFIKVDDDVSSEGTMSVSPERVTTPTNQSMVPVSMTDVGNWSNKELEEGPADIFKGSEEVLKGSGGEGKNYADSLKGAGIDDRMHGEVLKGSSDLPKGSSDVLKGSGDLLEGSGDLLEGSGDLLKGSGDLLKGSGDLLKGSGDVSKIPSKETSDDGNESIDVLKGSENKESENDQTCTNESHQSITCNDPSRVEKKKETNEPNQTHDDKPNDIIDHVTIDHVTDDVTNHVTDPQLTDIKVSDESPDDDYLDIGNASIEYDEFSTEETDHPIDKQYSVSSLPSWDNYKDETPVAIELSTEYTTREESVGNTKSPVPSVRHIDHHGDRHPTDHHDDRHHRLSPLDYRNNERYSKVKHERRSLTPNKQMNRTSPIPSRGRYTAETTPPNYASSSPRKNPNRQLSSPERVNQKRHTHKDRKYEDHTQYDKHQRNHSSPMNDVMLPHEIRHASQEELSSLTANHKYDQFDPSQMPRKRHNDSPEGEGSVKKHKIKRPIGSSHHYHHHRHDTQY